MARKRDTEAAAAEAVAAEDAIAEAKTRKRPRRAEVDDDEDRVDAEDLEQGEEEEEEEEEVEEEELEKAQEEGDSLEDEEQRDLGTEKKEKKKSKKDKSKKPKKGIIYIAHPPAFMKPAKVRHLMSQYGTVTKLYLVPEDEDTRLRRSRGGGSNKVKYNEGWIEFADRKVAKLVALSLNGKPIGGNRRSFHYESLWTLKYLSGFEWTHLSEKQAYERRTKKARLRQEISQAKRENELYLEKFAVEKHIQRSIQREAAAATDGHDEKQTEEDDVDANGVQDNENAAASTSAKKNNQNMKNTTKQRSKKRSFKQLQSRSEYKATRRAEAGDAEPEKEAQNSSFLNSIFT